MIEKNFNPLYIGKILIRISIIWIGETIGLYLLAQLSIGLTIDSWFTAAIAIVILEIINAIFWPTLTKIFLPFIVYTIGIGSLLLNGTILWMISLFINGLTIFGNGLILVPLGIAAIHTILTTILTLNDEDSYYNFIIRRKKIRIKKEKSGLIILEIDGLAKDILEEAIEKGYMPTLAKLKNEKTYKIKEWETDLSSQTGASQAGILQGSNKDIVAFRWVEKENNNKIMVSTGLLDAPLIEKRVSDGKGLLYKNGASRSNLFSGDTDNVLFTYSKMYDIKKFYNRTWYYVYSNPSNFGRILLLCAYDIIRELISRIKHTLKDIKPRIRRNFQYLIVRACANVYMREINTQTIIGDMVKGEIDIMYSTYLGYDEIAHHSGNRDEDAFNSLKGLDKQFKRIFGAKKYSPKDYQIIIQSDHGQSNGSTFKQRFNISLKELVHNLLPENMKIYGNLSSNEDHFSQAITFPVENVKNKVKDKTTFVRDIYSDISTKVASKSHDILEYIKGQEISEDISKKNNKDNLNDAEVIVLASGNLGLIYLTQWKERLNYETIKSLFPKLIPGLVKHAGIGFILVNSSEYGPLAIGKNGVYFIEEERVEGENPLLNFGENAAKHLLRTNSFKYCPDILVNSFYDTKNNEVAAFEELIGSHGGLGGTQNKPFIMYPSDWEIENEKIVGAEKLHKILKKQARELNII